MPSSVYKIMSETKSKVAAGRSHGSCGSAPRNYGSCHGCSFVDGVFAPRGGCPNHEPRKLHPLLMPFPYYFAYPPSHEAPRTIPSFLSVFHPLPSPPTSHPLLTLHSRRRLTLWYRRGSIDALARSSRDDLSKIGKLTIVDRHPFFHIATVRLACLCSPTQKTFTLTITAHFITRDAIYILNEHKVWLYI